jgi:hypothetical protein
VFPSTIIGPPVIPLLRESGNRRTAGVIVIANWAAMSTIEVGNADVRASGFVSARAGANAPSTAENVGCELLFPTNRIS